MKSKAKLKSHHEFLRPVFNELDKLKEKYPELKVRVDDLGFDLIEFTIDIGSL